MSATATKPKKKIDVEVFGGTISIPARCKPSQAVERRGVRPTISHAYLRRRDDGLWLCATDSYIAVAIKVEGTAAEGYVPVGALRHMERGKEAEQISATAWEVQTEPYATTTYDIATLVAGAKDYPDFAGLGLWEQPEQVWNGKDQISVGINPAFMARIGESFGTGDSTGCRFDIPGPLKAIRVTPLRSDIEAVALQMPIRLNV